MQKERLIIKNFITLKDVDIELGKYNVFIGEQASGKSLILKHLYFFRELVGRHMVLHYSLNSIYMSAIERYYEIFNLSGDSASDNSYVEYSINNYKIMIYRNSEIIFSNNLLAICDDYFTLQHKSVQQHGYNDVIINPESKDFISQQIYGAGIQKAINQFIPAVRVLLYSLLSNAFNMLNVDRNSLNIDYLLIQFGQNYQRARFYYESNARVLNDNTIFQKLTEKILKGKFIYDLAGDLIQHQSFSTKVVHSSSGQQEFVPIYLILLDMMKNKGNLYIEEPEAHLYPSAQKAITELLVYVTNATNSDGLYITTHSPYILTVLNNLILAYDVKDKQTLFDKDLLVPFEDVRAYYIADGGARDLRDTENRLILADNLDKISEQTALDFDKLLDMKYE